MGALIIIFHFIDKNIATNITKIKSCIKYEVVNFKKEMDAQEFFTGIKSNNKENEENKNNNDIIENSKIKDKDKDEYENHINNLLHENNDSNQINNGGISIQYNNVPIDSMISERNSNLSLISTNNQAPAESGAGGGNNSRLKNAKTSKMNVKISENTNLTELQDININSTVNNVLEEKTNEQDNSNDTENEIITHKKNINKNSILKQNSPNSKFSRQQKPSDWVNDSIKFDSNRKVIKLNSINQSEKIQDKIIKRKNSKSLNFRIDNLNPTKDAKHENNNSSSDISENLNLFL